MSNVNQLSVLNASIASLEGCGPLSKEEQRELAKAARRVVLLVVDHYWTAPGRARTRQFLELAAKKLQRLSHDPAPASMEIE